MFNIPFGGSGPIPTVIAGEGTKAPLTMIHIAEPGFTDAQLATVNVTRKQFDDWRGAKIEALRSFLRENPEASYLFSIRLPAYVHSSFMDIRQLGPTPDTQAAANLQMGIDFTLSFFDAQLRNNRQSWDQLVANPKDGVTVESLGARRR